MLWRKPIKTCAGASRPGGVFLCHINHTFITIITIIFSWISNVLVNDSLNKNNWDLNLNKETNNTKGVLRNSASRKETQLAMRKKSQSRDIGLVRLKNRVETTVKCETVQRWTRNAYETHKTLRAESKSWRLGTVSWGRKTEGPFTVCLYKEKPSESGSEPRRRTGRTWNFFSR